MLLTEKTVLGLQACCPLVPVPRDRSLGCGEAKFCV